MRKTMKSAKHKPPQLPLWAGLGLEEFLRKGEASRSLPSYTAVHSDSGSLLFATFIVLAFRHVECPDAF